MDITWFSNNMQASLSLYSTNVTLNTIACSYFRDAYATLVGCDREKHFLIIKAISKEEVDMGLYDMCDLHKLSIKPSYGRINGKNIVQNICSVFPLDFTKKQYYKFNCSWSQEDKYLVADLRKEEV